MDRSRSSPQAGFTLVEVLVSTLMLLVAVFAVLAAFPRTYRTATDAGRMSALGHVATEKAEALRALDYGHSDLSTGVHPSQSTDSKGAFYYPVSGYPETFSLRWTVSAGPTDGSGTAVTNIKTILIEATYATRYTSGGAAVTQALSLENTFRTYVTLE